MLNSWALPLRLSAGWERGLECLRGPGGWPCCGGGGRGSCPWPGDQGKEVCIGGGCWERSTTGEAWSTDWQPLNGEGESSLPKQSLAGPYVVGGPWGSRSGTVFSEGWMPNWKWPASGIGASLC